MSKNIKISLVVFLLITFMFVLIYIAGKSILPDLLGNSNVNNDTLTAQANEKLLYKRAPSFDMQNISGNRVKLSDYSNVPVVLVFWATWNQESADQIKIFDDYLNNHKTQSSLIQIEAVNSLEDLSIAKSFIKRGRYIVPVLLDITGDVSEKYNIKSLPTTYFIGKDGIVREIYSGILSEEMIISKVENLLK